MGILKRVLDILSLLTEIVGRLELLFKAVMDSALWPSNSAKNLRVFSVKYKSAIRIAGKLVCEKDFRL